MRARILWEQSRPIQGKDLNVVEPDWFIATMNKAFGFFPVELEKKDLERLEGMSATWNDIASNPFDALVRAVKRCGYVKVYSVYPPEIPEKELPESAED